MIIMIRNPMKPGDPVYDMAFNLYAMEESGLLMTDRGCLNHFCDLLLNGVDYDNANAINDLLNEAYINHPLTSEDCEYILKRTGISLYHLL